MFTQTTHHLDSQMGSRAAGISGWVQLISLATSCYNVGTIWMTVSSFLAPDRSGASTGPTQFKQGEEQP